LSEIIVTREQADWRDQSRSYSLVVDGSKVASIKPGETKRVSVEPGRHRIWMRLDYCRSPILEVDVDERSPARFICRPGGKFGLTMLYATVWRARYIDLRLQPTEPSDERPVQTEYSPPMIRLSLIRLAVLFAGIPVAFVVGWLSGSVNAFIATFAVCFAIYAGLRATILRDRHIKQPPT
jgi:hypothetical protein